MTAKFHQRYPTLKIKKNYPRAQFSNSKNISLSCQNHDYHTVDDSMRIYSSTIKQIQSGRGLEQSANQLCNRSQYYTAIATSTLLTQTTLTAIWVLTVSLNDCHLLFIYETQAHKSRSFHDRVQTISSYNRLCQ